MTMGAPSPVFTIDSDQYVRAAETAAYVKAGGFSGNDLVIALAIARAESGWDYKATHKNSNGTTDWGLFQINDVNKPTADEKVKPIENSRKAYSLFKAKGNFTDWATFKSGAYKQYMNAGAAAVKELNKRGSDFEKSALAKNGNVGIPSPGKLETTGPANPLDTISSWVADFGNKLFGFFNLSLGAILGLVLLALGIILLARGFAGKVVAGTVADMAKGKQQAQKAATAAAKPVREPKSIEARAADSIALSDAKKAIREQQKQAARDASFAKLRKL